MTRRLFIFGLGFSGLEIAKLARAEGWSVARTYTSEEVQCTDCKGSGRQLVSL